MSISGYVPDQYQLTVVDAKGDSHQVASSDVVQDFKISRKYNKVWSEIKLPCIVYQCVYKVEVTINMLALKVFLKDFVADDSISLKFYETSGVEKETKKFKNWKYKKSSESTVTVSDKLCTIIKWFSLDSNYSSYRNKSFLNVALDIQGVVLKYIACDIGVVTNSCQISSDYKILCAKHMKKTLMFSFWGKSNDCYGVLQKSKKTRGTNQLDSEEESDPNTLSNSRETKSVKLQMIIQSVEDCLKKISAIEDEGDQDVQIAGAISELNTSISKMIEPPQAMLPEFLLMVPPPFFPEDEPFDDILDY